jgi:ATPase family associated with various cellular activities (AAA)/Winged helix domain, variant
LLERGHDSAITSVAISLRERARAVIVVAVAEQTDIVSAVPGALQLLVHEPDDDRDLGAIFGLSPIAEAVLALALAPDLAPDLGAAFAFLTRDPQERRPSLSLALSLLREPPEVNLGVLDELAVRGLLCAHPRGTEPLSSAPLVPTAGLVAHLLGAPKLPSGVFLADDLGLDVGDLDTDPFADDAFSCHRLPALLSNTTALVHLHGVDRISLRESATTIARSLDRTPLFVLGVDLEQRPEISILADLTREAVLRSALVVIEDREPARTALHMGALPQPILHLGDSPVPPCVPIGSTVMPIAITPLDASERSALWRKELPPQLAREADRLGRRFRLSASEIRSAVAHAAGVAGPPGLTDVDAALLDAGARAQTGADLARLAPRVEVPPRWNLLVLTDDARAQLDELVSRVDQRSRVVDDWGFGERRKVHPTTALFVGPTGTGKSMAAEAVAERLGLALHRIDLSRVVSKYIGETEQQLDAIFEAASRTNAILFFDEADALFGKRSEVRDAHDRYANLEVSYLLQRMENYDSVALLATNLAANIDDAFARRLDFTVHFPFPDPVARRLLWSRAWPQRTPLDDLDRTLDEFAELYDLSGGNIRNIAVASAYLAASDGGVVNRGHVQHALQRELQKLGAHLSSDGCLVEAR